LRTGHKREEVAGDLRKLNNEELCSFCSLPNVFRMIMSGKVGWARHVACMGEQKIAYRDLKGKHEAKRPLGRPTHIQCYENLKSHRVQKIV
jgi:hypothetical protein